jgi:DNA repair protein RecO (recombination protein O)
VDRWEDEALVLGTLDYGEADRLVTLLTRERGKLTAFAAGARKSRRRFAGALEPGTVLRARMVERHGSTVRLDAVEVVHAFPRIRDELPRIARALYALELCRELLREQEPAPELLSLAVDWLRRLDAGEAGPTSVLAFELQALALAGLMPRFDACALCGGPPGDAPRFDVEHGGAVCSGCAARSRGPRVEPAVLQGLAAIQGGARQPLPPALRAEARTLLARFIEAQLGRRLKSVDFLRSVGVD